jgi:hypothetical protein
MTTALFGAGLAAAVAAAAPAKAESDPTTQNYGRISHHYYSRHHDYRRYGHWRGRNYAAPGYGYAYAPWPTWNGCQPHFTVQDGVCKPYRGY